MTAETAFTFPCEFPLKVMGTKDAGLETFVREVLSTHLAADAIIELKGRESSGGKYISLTAIIVAESKAQLDQLYEQLSAHEHVKMVL